MNTNNNSKYNNNNMKKNKNVEIYCGNECGNVKNRIPCASPVR